MGGRTDRKVKKEPEKKSTSTTKRSLPRKGRGGEVSQIWSEIGQRSGRAAVIVKGAEPTAMR